MISQFRGRLLAPGIVVAIVLSGCASGSLVAEDENRRPAADDVREIHRVYLVGDAGYVQPGETVNPVFDAVLKNTLTAPASRTLAFLGDNVYCCGLPDSASQGRELAQARLDKLIELGRGFGGRTVFIPGNHDWNNSGPAGHEYVQRMEEYVESALGEGSFLPDDALPGPVVVELDDDVVLVAIDTEWWLTRRQRPYGESGDYEIDEDLDFAVALTDVLEKHAGDRVLLLGHHPIFSQGGHNGRHPAKTHLFPLTRKWPKLYIPLPVLGSAYVLGTRIVGTRQDLPNRRYRQLRDLIEAASYRNESFVYAAGHEHSLQLFRRGPDHRPHDYIVSGASSRPQFVSSGGDAAYTSGKSGYATLSYFEDGAVEVAFWVIDEDGTHMDYSERLKEGRRKTVDPVAPADLPAAVPSTPVTSAINASYKAGPLKTAVLGSHNRSLWATPVEAPVLDLGTAAGGLTPVKRGGGMQTISLRLKGGDGHEYVLRSLDKDPSGTVPLNLQGTIATDVVQDQISSINPYGAFAIPPLARAAGVYHTLPQLVFVPDDPRLGPYREQFGGKMMMFEHRPDDDVRDFPNYGSSRKVVGATKLYEEIREDNDNRVDPEAFLRVRLFDMLLSDWDRHRGQWRWARFEDPDGRGDLYRPIPRDRDWAFNRMNGLISVLAPYFDPKFQPFNPRFGSIKGLATNGLEQDRRLLAGVTRDKWIQTAESIRDAITEEVIDEALDALPPPIRDRDGDRIRNNLGTRAEDLVRAAELYYEALASVVDIVGSDRHELFEAVREPNGDVTLRMYKASRDGERRQLLLERRFMHDETRQIRLFGLGGRDRFEISGEARRSIEVLAVGGPGKDTLIDSSRVLGTSHRTIYFDTNRSGEIDAGPETKLKLTDNVELNTYNSNDFHFNTALPQIVFSRNDDDGAFLGGGVILTRHRFKKHPFASQHRFVGSVAAKTGAFDVGYRGDWTGFLGRWGLGVEAEAKTPNNVRNFYGLGNDTQNTAGDRTFYQARLSSASLSPTLILSVNNVLELGVGPYLHYTDVREESDRFLAQQPGVSASTFDTQVFAGVGVRLAITSLDHRANPRQGARVTAEYALRYGLTESSLSFSRLAGDLAVYWSPLPSPQVTLAIRLGGNHNIGDFPFFEASTLGGTSNLRGFRSTRFAGRSAAWQNSELRIKVASVSSYVARGALGVLGFLDGGRVWTDGESSETIHYGYGGGVWLNVFNDLTVTGAYGISDDDKSFTIKMGFQY